ncbi:hypothetical protein BBK82_30275 [Lentzea guizhouensis]|uniref:EamA domain-containing protein n=1 Tax=Lentzea guizhouensis TaxID=1586287 RepID=A0A1B2HPS7_9PSEU|nr:hypothetical protein BBK82_30275 [Lentzea guizhouensis]
MPGDASTVGWTGKFVLLSAIWGSSFALIKVAVDAGVPPVQVALARCLFGAVALWLICVAQKAAIPRDARTWGHAAVVAVLLNSVPFTLLAFGESTVDSVLAGVLNATTPLTTLAFALLVVPGERVTRTRLAGLLLGFAGVLVLLGVWRGLDGDVLTGGLACLGATTCYGAGFAYTRRFLSGGPHRASAVSAVQITCATVQLGLAAPLLSGPPSWPGPAALLALLALGAVGTGYAYVLNLDLIRESGPTVAASVTYVTPLWSTAVGAVLLAEPVGWHTLAGGAVVIGAILLTRRPAPDRQPAATPTR